MRRHHLPQASRLFRQGRQFKHSDFAADIVIGF
jgi:hypothetical protein